MIELRKVTKEYSKGNAALNGVSVKIERGEFVFIVGDSGSGKSTLSNVISGQLHPESDGRYDHRKRTEPQPYEASSYCEVQERPRSGLPGFPSAERQKYL